MQSTTKIMASLVCYWESYKIISFKPRTKIGSLVEEIASREPLITPEILPELEIALNKIQTAVFALSRKLFYKQRVLETHLLPLTNIAIDRAGRV